MLTEYRPQINRMRPNRETCPWAMTNLKTLDGPADMVANIEKRRMLTQA
jgi:hypothetical protein